jgi:DNA-binding NarL/FixJ family response regulator
MWRGQEGVWLTQDAIERRASGRQRYNSWRAFLATYRRMEVVKLLGQGWRRGTIAAWLGVSPSAIGRDIQALMQPGRAGECCPTCGRLYAISLPPGYQC